VIQTRVRDVRNLFGIEMMFFIESTDLERATSIIVSSAECFNRFFFTWVPFASTTSERERPFPKTAHSPLANAWSELAWMWHETCLEGAFSVTLYGHF